MDREKTPRDEDDNYNFECLEAIDIEQFNKDMQALLAGEAVHLPIFDFKKGSRSYDTTPTQLKEQDILVIEGITVEFRSFPVSFHQTGSLRFTSVL